MFCRQAVAIVGLARSTLRRPHTQTHIHNTMNYIDPSLIYYTEDHGFINCSMILSVINGAFTSYDLRVINTQMHYIGSRVRLSKVMYHI